MLGLRCFGSPVQCAQNAGPPHGQIDPPRPWTRVSKIRRDTARSLARAAVAIGAGVPDYDQRAGGLVQQPSGDRPEVR
jgi:hypothetical protein